ncbi:uncharacterized protein ATNIH1004_002859 [Aspergillus tanneri]|uniref:Uncharacterized protein n=1 Tax=Aspergillus tanneri TaxID=1220188 RepID=A0A5M9MTG3_9EURO|nr:uncharacterized protein ATNIH1004_002859 [Aspergillus tanneri]KAA8650178.1 hypothetical protein ATNIH1004_002859 [Aspergillus tanneri]
MALLTHKYSPLGIRLLVKRMCLEILKLPAPRLSAKHIPSLANCTVPLHETVSLGISKRTPLTSKNAAQMHNSLFHCQTRNSSAGTFPEADATVAMQSENMIANSITFGTSFAAALEGLLTATTSIDHDIPRTSETPS